MTTTLKMLVAVAAITAGPAMAHADRPCGYVSVSYGRPYSATYRTPAYSYTAPVMYTDPVPVVYSYSPTYPGDAYTTQVVYPVQVVYAPVVYPVQVYAPVVYPSMSYGYRPMYQRPAVYRNFASAAPIYRVPFSGHRVPFSGHRSPYGR